MVRFLIIRFSSIGDIVLTSPVIRGLKTQVEDAEVHYLTKAPYKEILSSNPHLTKIHILSEEPGKSISELKEENFDYIIDLQNNMRSATIKQALKRMYFTVNKLNLKKWMLVNFKIDRLPDKHIVDRYMETCALFDVRPDEKGLEYFIPSEDVVDVDQLGEAFSNGYMVVVIGAMHNTKKMPLPKLIELTGQMKHPVVLVGGPEDQADGEKIKLALPGQTIYNGCGAWTINASASVMRNANVVITHDTGMMHVAAAFKKKIITIWGNTTSQFGMYPYLPDPQSKSFEVINLSCRPCSKLGKPSCPKKHFKCMMEQDIEEIASTANGLF